jgi:heavy metal sensor kinase
MSRPGIRWKLTLWYALVLAALLTAFSATVYWTVRHHLLQNLDRELVEELTDVRFEVERAADTAGLLVWLDRRFARHESFDYQILRPDGGRFFTSERMADRVFPVPTSPTGQPDFETVTIGPSERWRVVSMAVPGPDVPLTVQVARSLAAFERDSQALLWAFLLAGPLTVLATLAAGYFLASRTLAPIRRMNDTARHISAERLDRRIVVDNPGDELGQLAGTLNDMLDRLEQSFAEMQRFTADAAHELRTPLAVIRTEAEVALRSPRSSDEYGRVLENVLEETVRLSQMADQLLFLCRQDAGLNPPAHSPVPLGRLLEEIVSNMRLVAQEKGVALSLAGGDGCTAAGDDKQFRRVFYNLIDNAIKYTSTGGDIRVGCRQENGAVVVTVADTGIGIPEEHLSRIFDRFYRVDAARSGEAGAGLGLAICRSVVKGAGGNITVRSLPGKGSTFEVRLPSRTGVD